MLRHSTYQGSLSGSPGTSSSDACSLFGSSVEANHAAAAARGAEDEAAELR